MIDSMKLSRLGCLIAFAVCFCLLGAAPKIYAQDAKTLVAQASELKNKNDFDGAIKLLQQAVQLEPNNDTAYAEMAGAYLSKKDYPNATTFAEKSKSLNPKNELAWNLLGLIAKEQNDCEKAITNFSKVIEMDARANYTMTNRGYCYQTLKKNEEAIVDFSKAIEVNANYDSPYWGRAVSYSAINKHDESIADYTKYLTFKPNAAAFNNRGYEYYLLKNYDLAIADYRKSLEVDPNYSYAKGNLDWLLKNRPAESATASTAADVNVKTAEDAYKLAVAAYGNRDFDGALAYFTKTVELDPKYVYAYVNRALVYNKIKHDPEKARPDYKKAIEADPDNIDSYTELAEIDRNLGYYDEAIDYYSKLLPRLSGKIKDTDISFFYTLRGQIYRYNKNYELAIADLQKSIALNAGNSLAYDELGTVYQRKGDYETAITNYNKAIGLNPNNAETFSNRGLAFFYKGDYSGAMTDYNKAIELNPKFAVAYNNRAAVYDYLNKPDLEIADYKKAVELDPNDNVAKANLEIATSVLGDGTSSGSANSYVRFINAAIAAAERAYKNGATMPHPQACQNLFNSYLALGGAEERLSSLQNGIRFGSVQTPNVAGGKSLDEFAGELRNAKTIVYSTGSDLKCDFIRVVR